MSAPMNVSLKTVSCKICEKIDEIDFKATEPFVCEDCLTHDTIRLMCKLCLVRVTLTYEDAVNFLSDSGEGKPEEEVRRDGFTIVFTKGCPECKPSMKQCPFTTFWFSNRL